MSHFLRKKTEYPDLISARLTGPGADKLSDAPVAPLPTYTKEDVSAIDQSTPLAPPHRTAHSGIHQ